MQSPIPQITELPGAGIPGFQRFFLRYIYLPFFYLFFTPARAMRFWTDMNQQITDLVESTPPAQRDRSVLIPRQIGLEDSSRAWSMHWTLEHLIITATGMADVIRQLSAGHSPNLVISTALVKPNGRYGAAAMQEFTRTMQNLSQTLDPAQLNLHSAARQDHPWFGPLNIKQWYCFLALHHQLHLAQIREIHQQLTAQVSS
jgi:hypothetical protein